MTNEAEVYFSLFAKDFDPEEVTRLVGLQPTAARRRGDPTPKYSYWHFSSGKVVNDIIDVYELANRVVAQVKPHAERIAVAMNQLQLQAVLQVVLWITMDESKSTPAIGFEPEVIAFLSTLGASIDIDTHRNAT